MKILQLLLYENTWTTTLRQDEFQASHCQLVFAFGDASLICQESMLTDLRARFPVADIIFSSTSGEIMGSRSHLHSVAVTAIEFDRSRICCVQTSIDDPKQSLETGRQLMDLLPAEDLSAVFIISDGTRVNGSDLVAGINERNQKQVPVTGGLAGDGSRFLETRTGLNQVPEEGRVIAVGFYGKALRVGHGSRGGWDEFGPCRRITRSDKNILYEIDGRNALDLYKEYLGPFREELPASSLLFPLLIRQPGSGEGLVRTILSLDEAGKTMTFAGNMPENSGVRLMKANFDHLIRASLEAAVQAQDQLTRQTELAIMVSCIGRRIVLQHRTCEEVEAAAGVFGAGTAITGFYSYGELAPIEASTACRLHNQTMTITTFSEQTDEV